MTLSHFLSQTLRISASPKKSEMTDTELTDDVRQQILNALIAGRKIEAIKLYRAATGKGLKEAKDFIDLLVEEMAERDPELLNKYRSGCWSSAVITLMIGGLVYWVTR